MYAYKQNVTYAKILAVVYVILSTISFLSTGVQTTPITFGWIVGLTPHILFAIYTFTLDKNPQKNVFLLIIYTLMFVSCGISLLTNYATYQQLYYYADESVLSSMQLNIFLQVVLELHVLCCIISIATKLKNTLFIKISLIGYVAILLYSRIITIGSSSIISFLATISLICFYIVFWFFIFEKREEKINNIFNQTDSCEDKLVTLKNLYETGSITKEEYDAKKTEILNELV